MQFIGMVEAYKRNSDKIVPWGDITKWTFKWLIPVTGIWKQKPVYSVISFLFHIGLILTPLFLAAHVMLWKNSVGFGWFSLSQSLADWLTILVMITGPLLFIFRVSNRRSRFLSRTQDFVWPILLTIPFVTGYVCINGSISASTYQVVMFFHLYSANLIMILIPFSKIAHCVLMPISQYVTGIGWKLVPGAGDKVIETLGYKDRPTWVEKPRIGNQSVQIQSKE